VATILVVDDRPINRQFLATLLGYADHRVLEADDGGEALEIAHRDRPDLIISDILMPTMDGVQFVRRLTERPDPVPVMFYTATYRLTEARALAAECGVKTVVAKPAEPQDLLDAVHDELGIPRSRLGAEPATQTGRYRALTMQQLSSVYVEDLASLQTEIHAALSDDDTPSGRARRLSTLSTRFERSAARSQALSMRLTAVLELSLDLASQEDPQRVLELFCRAIRDIMNSKYAGLCIVEDGRTQSFVMAGVSGDTADDIGKALAPTAAPFQPLLSDGRVLRFNDVAGDPTSVGLPRIHPPIDNIMLLPIKTAGSAYGWCYVAQRLRADGFDKGDEQLAATLAAQVAPEYENLLLLDRIRRHAELLETQIDERKRAAAQLGETELRFRQLADNIHGVLFLRDPQYGHMLYVSPAYERIWQRSRDSLYAQPHSWFDAVHPDDRPVVEARSRSHRFDMDYRIVRPDGSVRWIQSRVFPIFDGEGKVYRVAGIAEDITQRKSHELRIRRLSRIYAVLSGINSAIVRTHERTALLEQVCRIAHEQGGFPMAWIGAFNADHTSIELVTYRGIDAAVAEELEGYLLDIATRRWRVAVDALRRNEPVVYNDLALELSPDAGPVTRMALASGYGSMIILPFTPDNQRTAAMYLYAEGNDYFDQSEVDLLVELARDVSFALQYIRKEEQLTYLAYYDSVTGLPNSTLFNERLTQALARDATGITAVILLDLDRFTQLNDSLGRSVGDRLLAETGTRLRASLPESIILARIASDTFALAVPGLRHETEAGALLRGKVMPALADPFHVDGHELRVTARAGIALYPNDGNDSERLFRNAEAALREAKGSGARQQFYSPQINARAADDLALAQKLLAAVEQRQFRIHYQPKIDSYSDAIVGLEALLRWDMPDEGLVAPARFIPALEDSELMLDVGRWVFEQAMADSKRWRQKGVPAPRIAVNVSPVQLRYPDFADMILRTLNDADMPGSALELEITESVIMGDIDANIEQLQKLSSHGIDVAIDDFGTGYSSLRYLAKLPVRTLKIDRSFVVNMTDDADSMTLVSTVIGLAHSFDLGVVAEGVDSEDQAKLLRLMKCDWMQGYLFGKPVSAEETERLLREAP
jgi:diguanylate cyclase (GGDEF)-like protein/PAS domain S-box-containing protein